MEFEKYVCLTYRVNDLSIKIEKEETYYEEMVYTCKISYRYSNVVISKLSFKKKKDCLRFLEDNLDLIERQIQEYKKDLKRIHDLIERAAGDYNLADV